MPHIIVNGHQQLRHSNCIRADDRGLTLGHGLFETMLINNGSVPLFTYHWDRLVTSLNVLGIKLPFDSTELFEMIDALIHENKLTEITAGLRLTITDGVSERGLLSHGNQNPTFIITTFCHPKTTSHSMTATIVKTKRNEHSFASRIKNISCVDNILAKKEAAEKGFDEAFLLNSQSNLAEGSLSNVFIVQNKALYTPSLIDGALPGIIRHLILNKLVLDDIEIKEQPINTDTLFNADEVFITNVLLGVMPISRLDQRLFQKPFTTAQLISTALKKQFNII